MEMVRSMLLLIVFLQMVLLLTLVSSSLVMEAIVHIFSDHFYIYIVTLGKIIWFCGILKTLVHFFVILMNCDILLIQVYYFKYPIFEIHIFHCIAPKFEISALFQILSQHVCLS